MRKMRHKIFLGYGLVSALFLLLLIPLMQKVISRIALHLLAIDVYHGTENALHLNAQVMDFTKDFTLWFVVFCVVAIAFLASVTWLAFRRIRFPLEQILKGVAPFQNGQEEIISPLKLNDSIDQGDDFFTLVQILNSLSSRLQSQSKSATDERNEKEVILESLAEGVIVVDSRMRISCLNEMASKMVGIPRRRLLGKKIVGSDGLPHTELLQKCCLLLTSCQERASMLTDWISIGESKKCYLELIAAPKAQHSGAILVLQDKSNHYKVLEMGKDFVSNASHELRTPITIIKGFAETLQDLPELPRDMVVDITEKIVRNCQRMDNLVKNLLTLADLENLPKSRFQQCDLVALVESCRQVVLSVYEHAQIAIEKNCDVISVAADPDMLELAIINLLDNAAKYSNPPAQVTISLVREGAEVKISISDKGIGIPNTDLEHIFERFYTVDKARSRRLGGAGLGLSIVRTIVEKHEGTISVDSEAGSGSSFKISLPAGISCAT